jgi:hypothetical protein
LINSSGQAPLVGLSVGEQRQRLAAPSVWWVAVAGSGVPNHLLCCGVMTFETENNNLA